MGGFSSQIQLPQSSAPAGKNAGMSAMQMGQNPIEQSPEEQLLKTQQLQMEQPSLPQGPTPDNGQMGSINQAMPMGMGMLGGTPAQQLQNPYQAQLNNNAGTLQSTNSREPQGLTGFSPMLEDGPMGSPQGKSGGQGKVTFPTRGGQPKMGMPNAYSNTMQPWDNEVNQSSQGLGGKGLGSAMGQMAKPTGKGA